jgi:hypoxanthine-guanine phosphoribosyltransferase
MPLNEVTFDRLKGSADEILNDRETVAKRINEYGQIVKEKAEQNAALCVGLL